MLARYGNKKNKYGNIYYAVLTLLLVCGLLMLLVTGFYNEAEDEAYEMLHMQTKQIKDNLVLQIKSDRENLVTMANFAAKLHSDGERYDILLDSFKPIGLFSEVGILNPDNTFVTRAGQLDLSGKISFEQELELGEYISGRVMDLTVKNKEVLRSAVPIISNGTAVGIMYGIVPLELINQKYSAMAKEQDAQLFVYNKNTGKFIVDTFNENPGFLSDFKTREFNEGYSYEQLVARDKGFSSFKSILTGEDLYVHYSTIEELNWGIMLAKYETDVFKQVRDITGSIIGNFVIMGMVVFIYLVYTFTNEKRKHMVTEHSADIRKLLLDFNQNYDNVFEAMKSVLKVSASKTVFFADTDGEEYHYIAPDYKNDFPDNEEWKYFIGEIFGYISVRTNKSGIGIAYVEANFKLSKKNPDLYRFMKKYGIKEVSFSIATNRNNHVSILGTVNSRRKDIARDILNDIAACFSIAVYNRKHLNKTELAATTDSLTGAFNRVAYKNDIQVFDDEKPEDFACVYVDVNELHIRNNKYGHAAGDEMLIFIANTLKEVFYGNRVYRMGGDEFLVFTRGIAQSRLGDMINLVVSQLKPREYNIAVGMSYRKKVINCDELVREAEVRMYTAKSQYYLSKEQSISENYDDLSAYEQARTGIKEIDTMISVLKEHYNGIYKVSLLNDNAHRILMPSYLGYKEDEKNFSRLVSKYIEDFVASDYQRPLLNFLNYDAIIKQLSEGKLPRITYKKTDGEAVVLTVYRLDDNSLSPDETLWVFAKE